MLYPDAYIFIYDQRASKPFVFPSGAVRKGAAKIQGDGRLYTVSLEGEASRRKLSFKDAKAKVKRLLVNYPNHKVTMRAFLSGDSQDLLIDHVRFARISTEPPLKDTPGVLGIDRFVTWLESEVEQGRLTSRSYAGICVCKSTSSGGHSDHADCAAIDVFGTNHDMEVMRDTAIREADYFNTKYAILFQEIWFPDGSSRPYTGQFHAHLHLSVTGGVYNKAC
jgi:hypothetical protein